MNGCQVSISTAFAYHLPIEAQIPLVAQTGFTHISLGENQEHMPYLSPERRQQLKRLLAQHHLAIDTIHGPHADQPNSLLALTQVADAAVDLGTKIVVCHAGPFDFPANELPQRLDNLRHICSQLDQVAQQTGVIFALENVLPGPATDLVRQILPELNPQGFGFCYDSSHDQIGGPKPFDLLLELSDRVVAVHLSDRIRDFVDHVIPGEGFIDWEALIRSLKQSRFAGPVLLEVLPKYSPQAQQGIDPFLRLAYARAVQLSQRMTA